MVENIRYNRKFGIKLIESGERERIVGFLFSRLTSLYTYYPFLDHNIVSIWWSIFCSRKDSYLDRNWGKHLDICVK